MKKKYKLRLHALVLGALCCVVPVSAGAVTVAPGDAVLAVNAISKSEVVNRSSNSETANANSKSEIVNVNSKSETADASSNSEITNVADEKTDVTDNMNAFQTGIMPQLVSYTFTTVDNKELPLPIGVTVFDFKRMVTPVGVIDGTQVMSSSSMNENYVENIRRRADEAKMPELKAFSGQVYRDWNMYQFQGQDEKAHHTAYVTEIALGPDFINGERADLAITKTLLKRAQENPSSYYGLYDNGVPTSASVGALETGAYYLENMADILNYSGAEPAEGYESQTRKVLLDMMERNAANKEQYLALYPKTYDSAAYYNATWTNLQSMPFMENAAHANQFIAFYKEAFTDAVKADLAQKIKMMETDLEKLIREEHAVSHTPQSEYKIADKPEKWFDHYNKLEDLRNQLKLKVEDFETARFFYSQVDTFMDTSTISFDRLENKQVHSNLFGDMIQSEVRGALYFDSYEIPVGAMSYLRFDEQGPVFTIVTANDGDFPYWKEQINQIWQIQTEANGIEQSAVTQNRVEQNQRNQNQYTQNQRTQNQHMQNHLTLTSASLNVSESETLTVKKLSESILIPFVFKMHEKGIQEGIDKGPIIRDWKTKELFTGQDLEKSREYYKSLLKQQDRIDTYRLGKMTEVYQWQVNDVDGRKTATVLSLALTPEVMKNLGVHLSKDQLNTMLPVLNNQWINSEGPLNRKVQEWLGFTGANHFAYNSINLVDQTPITLINQGKHDAYRAGTRAFVNINGVELPYYLDGAIVYTNPYPVALLMITSDAERNTFMPEFESFITNL
ncbi:MAG: hypothetical protein KHZ77_07910 [Veillonella sp.]|uniref:hypothetical protein n=1 Tax=Veillonella sp. TaxID=1926307 RepID=UPI0025F3A87F|nr:hypothetical protein [Veillonella sp.]MBS4914057.1 hypothetical protein [Veillonella sp.]